jgi:cell division protein FtsL
MDLMFVLMAAAAVGFWGSVLYLALRFVRAAERRSLTRNEIEELRTRVSQLEEDLSAAQTEMQRLAAAERFAAQLLAGRPRTE